MRNKFSKESGIKIESGIPIPPRSKSGELSNAIRNMKAGQSFFVPTCGQRTSASIKFRNLGIKYVSRKEANGFRFWRVE